MGAARDWAWAAAQKLAAAAPEEFEREMACHDEVVTELGRSMRSPGGLLGLALHLIRVRETKRVLAVIAALRM